MIRNKYGGGEARFPHRFPHGKARRRPGLSHAGRTPPPDAALTKAFLAFDWSRKGQAYAAAPAPGREIAVPQAASHVARFDYADLCKQPLGAADFLAIAENFHTLIVDHIPIINARSAMRPSASSPSSTRFTTRRSNYWASAAAEADQLYKAAQGREAFEFARTASRLTEMRSTNIWRAAWSGRYCQRRNHGACRDMNDPGAARFGDLRGPTKRYSNSPAIICAVSAHDAPRSSA